MVQPVTLSTNPELSKAASDIVPKAQTIQYRESMIDPNKLIERGDAPMNPALFPKINISGLSPLLACEKRNPGYMCFYKERLPSNSAQKTGIVAYKPSEICQKDNFPIYQNTQVLNRQFRKSYPITLYMVVTTSLLFVIGITALFTSGLLFEGLLGGLIVSFVFIFIHAYFSSLKMRKDQLIYRVTPMHLNSCYVNLQFYGKVLSMLKKDQTYNEVNPETFTVAKYEAPNINDKSVMFAIGKWKFRETGDMIDIVNTYKELLLNPKIEKL